MPYPADLSHFPLRVSIEENARLNGPYIDALDIARRLDTVVVTEDTDFGALVMRQRTPFGGCDSLALVWLGSAASTGLHRLCSCHARHSHPPLLHRHRADIRPHPCAAIGPLSGFKLRRHRLIPHPPPATRRSPSASARWWKARCPAAACSQRSSPDPPARV